MRFLAFSSLMLVLIACFAASAGAAEPTEFESPPMNLQSAAVRLWSAVYSPDGNKIATVSGWDIEGESGELVLWDVATGKEEWVLDGDKGIRCVAFAPDGKHLAIGEFNRLAKLVDVKTGKVVMIFQGHTSGVNGVAFSPDGRTLYTASLDRTARAWEVDTGKVVQTFEGHDNVIYGMDVHPLGKQLATSSSDGQIKLWDTQTGKEVGKLEGHKQPVEYIVYSPDGKLLASASWDGSVNIWDIATRKATRTHNDHTESVLGVCFSPDGKRLASIGTDRAWRLYDVAGGLLQTMQTAHDLPAYSIRFAPQGDALLTSGWDRQAKIWDLQRNTVRQTLERGPSEKDPPEGVLDVAYSPDGRRVASAHEDTTVRIRDAETGELLFVLEGHDDVVADIAFSANGHQLATAGYDNTIQLWDLTQEAPEEPIRTFDGHTNWVFAVAFHPDGKRLISGSYDKTVRIWELKSGRELANWEGHTGAVRSVVCSPDGKWIVTAGSDKTIRLWDETQDPPEVATLEKHAGEVRCLQFSPDGKTLASAGEDRTIFLWDLARREVRSQLDGHSKMVWALQFSPQGTTLVSGGMDNRIRVWDPRTGTARQSLRGHTDVITSLAFSPSGNGLLSGSLDRTLRRWRPRHANLPPIAELSLHQGAVRFVYFAPDGKRMYTGDSMRQVVAWDTATGQPVQITHDDQTIQSGALSPDGKVLATIGASKHVTLWATDPLGEIGKLEGEHAALVSVTWSSDGKRLATGSQTGFITAWDMSNREPLFTSSRQTLPITSLSFAPHGRTLVSGSGDWKQWKTPGEVKLWNASSGKELVTLNGPRTKIGLVAYTADGNFIAATGASGDLFVYHALSHALIEHRQLPSEVTSATFLPQGQIAAGHLDGKLRIWDPASFRETTTFEGHSESNVKFVCMIAAAPDGSVLASAGADGKVRLWSPNQRAAREVRAAGSWVHRVAFVAEQQVLINRGPENSLQQLDITSGREVRRLPGHAKPITAMGVSSAKRPEDQPAVEQPAIDPVEQPVEGQPVEQRPFEPLWALTADQNLQLRFWDLKKGEEVWSIASGHTGEIRAAAVSSDGAVGVTGGFDHRVLSWDLAGSRKLHELKLPSNVYEAEFIPGTHHAVITGNQKAVVWDADSGAVLKELEGHPREIVTLCVSADGSRLLTGTRSGTIRLWDLETGKLIRRMDGHFDSVRCLAFSPDGKRAVSGSYDRTLVYWNLADGKIVERLDGHTGRVLSVAISPDGQWAASGGADYSVRLWRLADNQRTLAGVVRGWPPRGLAPVATVQLQHAVEAHPGSAWFAIYGAQGKRIISGGRDPVVRVWDAATLAPVARLEGHTGSVIHGSISPDGKLLATCGMDKRVKLWNTEDWSLERDLEGHTGNVRQSAFSPDNRRLATASEDKTVRVWDLATGKQLFHIQQPTGFYSVAYSPDGKLLATGGGNWRAKEICDITLWNAETGKQVRVMKDSREMAMSVTFSPDGKQLAARGANRRVSIWNVEDGSTEQVFGRLASTRPLQFSPTEDHLLVGSGSSNGFIWILDTVSGNTIVEQKAHEELLFDANYSRDGKQIVTASQDGFVKTWKLQMTVKPQDDKLPPAETEAAEPQGR